MKNIQKYLNNEICNILKKQGFEVDDALVNVSNRHDLADYQSNIIMALAKKIGKKPAEILESVLPEINNIDIIAEAASAGPGFINMRLTNDTLENITDVEPEKFSNKTIVMDYGGPNIAKALHVGHLRAAIIGESVKRIMRAAGDKVIADVHFGDFGRPIGMLIAQLKKEQPGLDVFQENFYGDTTNLKITISELSTLYVNSAASFENDDEFKQIARKIVNELQNGNKAYNAIWRVFFDVSIASIKEAYSALSAIFDCYYGESNASNLLPVIFNDLAEKKLIIKSDGAMIVPLKDKKGEEKAPLLVKTSDDYYTYAATDLATILQRMHDFKPDGIIYFTDSRQNAHFVQVFEVARMVGYIPDTVFLEHRGFGTVNGKDGKPFKTRSGGTANLADLITTAIEIARAQLPETSEQYSADELNGQARQIGIASLKYQDLKNNTLSDYVFDVENFTKSEGKTGPYLQYAVARVNSILSKAKAQGIMWDEQHNVPIIADNIAIKISSPLERELLFTLIRLPEFLEQAYLRREPSVIADFVYELAHKFSTLYNNLTILNEPDLELKRSRLKIAELTRSAILYTLDLLGIEAPDRMLRKAV